MIYGRQTGGTKLEVDEIKNLQGNGSVRPEAFEDAYGMTSKQVLISNPDQDHYHDMDMYK